MAPGFNLPTDAELYRRTPTGDFDSRGIREYPVIARLKPGVTIERAQARLNTIAQQWVARLYREL